MDDAATELILEIFRLNGRLLDAGDALVADLGLTSALWQVLGAVMLAPTPLPVAHLARTMGLARQSVQRSVDELAGRGLLGFGDNPHHRRAKLVLVTEAGAAAYAAASVRQRPWAAGLIEGRESEVRAATALLRGLRERLEAAG